MIMMIIMHAYPTYWSMVCIPRKIVQAPPWMQIILKTHLHPDCSFLHDPDLCAHAINMSKGNR